MAIKDDVRNLIYTIFGLFIIIITGWIAFVFVYSCGFSLDCEKAAGLPERTPIPTLIPAGMPVSDTLGVVPQVSCQISAVDLLGAWIIAGYPEEEAFSFTDLNDQHCTGTYAEDITPLLQEGNLWYNGAPACTTCHNPTLNESTAGMDLSTYEGILSGSRRTSSEEGGKDILGGGNWESSLLYEQLFVKQVMPQGRPPDVPAEGPVIFAGSVVEEEPES